MGQRHPLPHKSQNAHLVARQGADGLHIGQRKGEELHTQFECFAAWSGLREPAGWDDPAQRQGHRICPPSPCPCAVPYPQPAPHGLDMHLRMQ